MKSQNRWTVVVDLYGQSKEPRPYNGPSDDGAITERMTYGTSWRGIGATPEAALRVAHEDRTSELPIIEGLVKRLETVLDVAHAVPASPAVPADVIMGVRSYLGESRVPPVSPTARDIKSWIGDLRRALDVP